MAARTVVIPEEIDLRTTVGGLKEAGRVLSPDEVWWASRTPEGPGSMRIVRSAADRVEADAWGPGADWMLHRAPTVCGAEDDLTGFEAHHEAIASAQRRHGTHRFGPSGRVFEAIVPGVLGQKVQTAMARRSWRAILHRFGDPAPGPTDLRLLPSPERFAELGYAPLHRAGVERKRASTILRSARMADRIERAADDVGAESTLSERSARLDRVLRSVPGIGAWTSSYVRMMALGDPDAVMVGDYHLPNTVAWGLAGEPRGDDSRMLELLEPYAGHRARAQRMLKLGGVRAPRYGPKLAFQPIEHL